MNYLFVFLLLVVSTFTSCTKQQPVSNDPKKPITETNDYSISINEAILSLEDFYQQVTKSESKQVDNIVCVPNPYYNIGTKSGTSDNIAAPNILYVVNYENEGGYAILSADRRLPTEIYAISDKGEISESDIYDMDYISPANLVYQSAVRSIIPGVDTTIIDPLLPPGGNPIEPDPFDPPDGEWIVTEWGPWNTVEYIPQMLITKWHQGSPFNDLVAPNYAGCTPIALFQIIAYNQYPTNYQINRVSIPLSIMRNLENISTTSMYANAAAVFVKNMHDSYHDSHWENQTLMFPTAAQDYLQTIGYSNVQLYRDASECDINIILSSLRQDYPVMISALANITSGHSWVIDGYLKQYRIGEEYGEESGTYFGSKSEERVMVHCNWGWNGSHDGYFYAGVFDINSPANVDPTATQFGSADYYDSYYRIITYEINN